MLLGWPLSWVAVALWLFHRGKTGWEYAIAAAAAGSVVFYFLYRARQQQYYVEAGHLLIILGAIGIVRTYRWVRCQRQGRSRRALLITFVLCSYALGAISIWPNRLGYFRQRASHERIVWEAISDAGVHRAIVFLEDLPSQNEACVGRNSPNLVQTGF